jgi:hypothetical protein
MTREDATISAIIIQRAAKLSHVRGCLHPARRFRIELSQLLKLQILLLRQELDAHGGGHIGGAVFRFMFFPRIQRFTILAKTGTIHRTLLGTIKKDVLACVLVVTNHIGFTAGFFHFTKRLKFVAIGFQACSHVDPFQPSVAVHIFPKTAFQYPEQFFRPFW